MRHSIPSTLRAPRFWAELSRALLGFFMLCAGVLLPVAHAQQADFLPPDEAFQFTAKVQDAKTVLLQFKAHDGYYLYQERFHFESQTPGVELGKPEFPPAHKIFDKTSATRCFTTAVWCRFPCPYSRRLPPSRCW